MRTSSNSLTVSNISPVGLNLNGILDNNFIDSTIENSSTSPAIDDDDDDDDPHVERIQTEDGFVHDIRIYQVYLLGMSGTGKCSLLRQFKTTEYRGIYDYSSSVGKLIYIYIYRLTELIVVLIANGSSIYIQMVRRIVIDKQDE